MHKGGITFIKDRQQNIITYKIFTFSFKLKISVSIRL